MLTIHNIVFKPFLGKSVMGLSRGDWGCGPNPKPQTPIPQSPIPNPHDFYFSNSNIINLFLKIIIS